MRTTTNYDLFCFHETNREVDLNNPLTKNLVRSMESYGWLKSHPAMVVRRSDGKFIVIDAQHRVRVARHLKIPVCYQEVTLENKSQEALDQLIKEINNSQKSWSLRDYIESYAKSGSNSYNELLAFHKKWGIPLGLSAALLAGCLTSGAVTAAVRLGKFRILARNRANSIAEASYYLAQHHAGFSKRPALMALAMCFRVDYFQPERLISSVHSSRQLIRNAANTDGWLEDIDSLYNYRRSQRKPLAFDAAEAARK